MTAGLPGTAEPDAPMELVSVFAATPLLEADSGVPLADSDGAAPASLVSAADEDAALASEAEINSAPGPGVASEDSEVADVTMEAAAAWRMPTT